MLTLLQVTETIRAGGEAAQGLATHGETGIAIGALVLSFVVIIGGGVLLRSLIIRLVDSVPDKERVDDALKALPAIAAEVATIRTDQGTMRESITELAKAQSAMTVALQIALDRGNRAPSATASTG